MVVFRLCDPEKSTFCESKEKILDTLEGSYILTIENLETYNPQNDPDSGEMFAFKTHISWYAISSN